MDAVLEAFKSHTVQHVYIRISACLPMYVYANMQVCTYASMYVCITHNWSVLCAPHVSCIRIYTYLNIYPSVDESLEYEMKP